MIQAHKIRRNDSSRWPRRFLFLDTETRSEVQPSGHRVQTWRCGATIYDGWSERKKERLPPVTCNHATPADLWRYVYDTHVPRSRTVLVAHNLGFDLRASNAFCMLPNWHWKLIKIGVHGKNLTVTWRLENGATLVCVDSHSWLPMSLARIGELIGHPKPADPEPDDDEGWLDRCREDVSILREAMLDIWNRCQTDELGTFQRTGAGMAWANWRHKHYTHEVIVHDNLEARDAELAATYTGRCEAWKHGTFTDGPYDEWDLSLAYARCAQEIQLPVSLYGHLFGRDVPIDRINRGDHRVLARATVDTDVPVLPARTCDGIIWPVGKFTGWWWRDELKAAEQHKAVIRVTEAWIYRCAPALRQWADWIIDTIEFPMNGWTEVQRAMLKHWSRALIGKFASRYDNWQPLGTNPSGDVCLMPCIDREGGELSNILLLGDQALISTVEELGQDACPSIQGAVMAACRVKLWQVMNKVQLDNVYYVDTDSVITDNRGSSKLHRDRTTTTKWGLRRKRQADRLTVYGPRQLVLDDERRFAGVPRNAVEALDGSLRGEVWESAEQALRRGRTGQITTIPACWRPIPTDKRRVRLEGGVSEARRLGA